MSEPEFSLTDEEVEELAESPCGCGRHPCHLGSHWFLQRQVLADRMRGLIEHKRALWRAEHPSLWKRFWLWVFKV